MAGVGTSTDRISVQLDFVQAGTVEAHAGAKIGRYNSGPLAEAAARQHIRTKASDTERDVVAGAMLVRESGATYVDLYEITATVDGKEVPYALLAAQGEQQLIPRGFVDVKDSHEVVGVFSGSVPPSIAKSAADSKRIVDGAAQQIPKEPQLWSQTHAADGAGSKEGASAQGATSAQPSDHTTRNKVLKWGGVAVGGVAAALAGIKLYQHLAGAPPLRSALTMAVFGTGAAYGVSKLLADGKPISGDQARIGMGMLGAAAAVGGGAMYATGVLTSNYIWRVPATRVAAAGLGAAVGALALGELVT